ncbi:hypothetical protein MPSEU_000127100 [Mayamaea pseudoterrestris]|nr:hypothetical protein MPSEU_000127100 [Mayamaea pseudoterrestris]
MSVNTLYARKSRRAKVGFLPMIFLLVAVIFCPCHAFRSSPGLLQRRIHCDSTISNVNRYLQSPSASEQYPLSVVALPDDAASAASSAIAAKEQIPKTLSEAMYTFLAGPFVGPRITLAIVFSAIAYRFTLPLSLLDPMLLMSAIILWWFQEHAMHKHLLHSKFDWYGRRIHEVHHQKNYFHISLDPAWLMVTWLSTVFVMLKCVLPLPLALTTAIGYAGAGLFYEWSHYIVHTKVRFAKGSYWQRMKDHHIRHHLINAGNWLGFSLPQVDTLFGTNPSVQEFRRQEAAER